VPDAESGGGGEGGERRRHRVVGCERCGGETRWAFTRITVRGHGVRPNEDQRLTKPLLIKETMDGTWPRRKPL
jgi:hypothetical protein